MQAFIIISRDAQKSSRLINQHLTSGLGAARSTERAVVRCQASMADGSGGERKGRRGLSSALRHSGNAPVPKRVCERQAPTGKNETTCRRQSFWPKAAMEVTPTPRWVRPGWVDVAPTLTVRSRYAPWIITPLLQPRQENVTLLANLPGHCASAHFSHSQPFFPEEMVILNLIQHFSCKKVFLYELNLI